MPGNRWLLTLALLMLAVTIGDHRSLPLVNGKIAYTRLRHGQRDICVINADGSGQRLLIADGRDPAYSPVGNRLAFVRGGDLYLASTDGLVMVPITQHASGVQVRRPAFSPDGAHLVFALRAPGEIPAIWTIAVDGSDEHLLVRDGADPVYCAGRQVVFTRGQDLYHMDADGMHVAALTRHVSGAVAATPAPRPDQQSVVYALGPRAAVPAPNLLRNDLDDGQEFVLLREGADPTCSPDGRYIAFVRDGDLYLADAAGRMAVPLTRTADEESAPTWMRGR